MDTYASRIGHAIERSDGHRCRRLGHVEVCGEVAERLKAAVC